MGKDEVDFMDEEQQQMLQELQMFDKLHREQGDDSNLDPSRNQSRLNQGSEASQAYQSAEQREDAARQRDDALEQHHGRASGDQEQNSPRGGHADRQFKLRQKKPMLGGGFSRNQEGIQRAIKRAKDKEPKKPNATSKISKRSSKEALAQIEETSNNNTAKKRHSEQAHQDSPSNQAMGSTYDIRRALRGADDEEKSSKSQRSSQERITRLQQLGETMRRNVSMGKGDLEDRQQFLPAPEQTKTIDKKAL